jgi:UDP-N-acetylmuramyl tripeptide synthase
VDYAHTPDALTSILETLANRAENRLITVFGCGGDRDPSKRPLMGKSASVNSDIVIVTSDNPRTEDPEKIIDDILTGIDNARGRDDIIVEPDRAKALEFAVRISRDKDTILAAGKGHETYQMIKSGRIDFDDRLILKQALETMAEGR